jgi:hypothetical protein
MPRRPSPKTAAPAHGWQRRVRSPAFARELKALIAREITALADQQFKDVVDVRMVHAFIERADELLAVDAVTALLVGMRATARKRARQTKRSLGGMLGAQLVGEIESALADATNLTSQAEGFIAQMMERELAQSLMTDLIYTAIVSFNRRVNPIFGNLALMAVDTQVKGFIRMLMPMLQRQATAFLVDRKNHVLFADFARAAARQVLSQPLAQLSALLDRGSDAEAEALITKVARNAHVRRLVRDGTRMLADAAFAHLSRQRIGDVVLLDDNIDWLAERISAPLLALLRRPRVAAFVQSEMEGGAPRRRR